MRFDNPFFGQELMFRYSPELIDEDYKDHLLVKHYNKINSIVNDYSQFSVYDDHLLTGTCLCEHGAQILHLRQESTSRIIRRILNMKITDMANTLVALKKKKLSLFLVGFGGTGSSFLYWLNAFCHETEIYNIFDSITVADFDKWDYTNLPRIPFVPSTLYKVDSATRFFCGVARKYAIYLGSVENFFHDIATDTNHSVESVHEYFRKMNMVFYGAPDIATRAKLVDMNLPFVAGTHRANQAFLIAGENYEGMELAEEGYGILEVSVFHRLQINMVYRFLKYLSEVDGIENLNISETITVGEQE